MTAKSNTMATDHFGKVADSYASYRPSYPAALFDWLASQCAEHALAWDCGAGSGQASVALAAHFDKVIATDLSDAQLAHATDHPRIEYRVALAEHSGLPDCSVDLVTIAQAMHWFDLDRFYAEVKRVLKPDGLIAAWTYGVMSVEGNEVDAVVQHFYGDVIGPYWPPERHHVETGYRELPFPFARIPAPPFAMEADWTLDQLTGYMRSWSASARYAAAHGTDGVDALSEQLRPLWGAPDSKRNVRWPLAILAGR